MKRVISFLLLVFMCFIVSSCKTTQNFRLEKSVIKRPNTLPKGQRSYSFIYGKSRVKDERSDPYYNYVIANPFYWRYSISDKVDFLFLAPLGFEHEIYNTKKFISSFAYFLNNYGYSSYSGIGLDFGIKQKDKIIFRKDIALYFEIYLNYLTRTKDEDLWGGSLKLLPLYEVVDRVTLAPKLKYVMGRGRLGGPFEDNSQLLLFDDEFLSTFTYGLWLNFFIKDQWELTIENEIVKDKGKSEYIYLGTLTYFW